MNKAGRAELLTNIPAREDLKNVLEDAGFEVLEAGSCPFEMQEARFSNLAAMLTEVVLSLSEDDESK